MRDDEAAFPGPLDSLDHSAGMSLRDYFAAKALNGILCNAKLSDVDAAAAAYIFADAMMAERAK